MGSYLRRRVELGIWATKASIIDIPRNVGQKMANINLHLLLPFRLLKPLSCMNYCFYNPK